MPRLRLTLAYEGTAFAGSQVQPGRRTVQGVLEEAVQALTGEPTRATFAGRTDAGVHAIGQVVHLDVARAMAEDDWRRALDAHLPPDVRVTNVAFADAAFHARYSARWREYRYRVWNGPVQAPQDRHWAWHRREPLAVDAMRAAAQAFVGEHAFAAFAGLGKGAPDRASATVRTVRVARWTVATCPWPLAGTSLTFTVEANGFLPHMVRNMVGSLVVVGRGAAPVTWIAALIEGRDRRLAGPTAPAHGLTLWRVRYDDDDGGTHAETGDVKVCRH
jgi:tRNA pseudouridine38-40 synthase